MSSFGVFGAVLGITGLAAYLSNIAQKYSVTSHGNNPWTLEAFLNILSIEPHVKKAMVLVDGTINDAYRSPAINALVGGVKTSYHQLGLAVDLRPNSMSPEAAARLAYSMATTGDLGPVRTVIWEPSWLHLDYHNPKDVGPPPPVRFFKLLPSGKYEKVEP